jgi:predicted ABC-type ATPase
VEHNSLHIQKEQKINSYIAADLAEFIRQKLVKSERSFSYETVMSDRKKIGFLKKAKKAGYRIYLYYFATETPSININRVRIRVAQKGHNVKADVIEKRYYKSLENLKSAVQISDRAYIFDNSLTTVLIAQITGGENVTIEDKTNVPLWFERYLVLK